MTMYAHAAPRFHVPADYAVLEPDGAFLTLALYSGNGSLHLAPPVFNVDGQDVFPSGFLADLSDTLPETVFEGVRERRLFFGFDLPHLRLEVIARASDNAPVVRFCYRLHSDRPARLTKPDGHDRLTYFAASFTGDEEDFTFKEMRFSEFSHFYHTFLLTEYALGQKEFDAEVSVMGPFLVATNEGISGLVAYEHGSQYPDTFLTYDLQPGGDAVLRAVKGNYYDGQIIGPDAPWQSVWFQAALMDGDENRLASAYREWVLRFQTPNRASRKPYLFYNTWNHQERVFNWHKKPYLSEMNEARMLAEIDIAHQMGLDVFVIDTGWYEKTGDWQVSTERFPRGLTPIKAKLDEYQMHLGLWFNPTVAAVGSQMRQRHEDCLMTRDGKPGTPYPVWETEESQGISLVSRYWEAFADELIRLNREVGVTYFKWDAIGQYGSDAANHFHGTDANSAGERRDCYAFLLGDYMTRVVNRVCEACPDAIVDFDITEGGRTVGLQFLSAGKYFLINNGPYNADYNMPVPADGNVNLFFYPGPARAWICRVPLTYDKWIPSVLFLTHYLPDPDYTGGGNGSTRRVTGENLWITVASLVLGQNGIWGDLCALPPDAIANYGRALGLYKQVRDDITGADPVRVGMVGGSPEVHEKINRRTGKGVVSLFADAPGTYTYVTENQASTDVWHNDGAAVRHNAQGQAIITATFANGQKAKVVFFGVTETR